MLRHVDPDGLSFRRTRRLRTHRLHHGGVLADFLHEQQYAALLHATNLGTVLLVKSPRHEISSVRGRVPIGFNHELYAHPCSPVIRILTRIYDQPTRPLALETFINVGDPDQRADYEADRVRAVGLLLNLADARLPHWLPDSRIITQA